MKKQTYLLVLAVFVVSMSCQFLIPTTDSNRDGVVISSCADAVSAVRSVQPRGIPQALLDTGIKQGEEFDVNEYFKALPHLSMQDGYLLDFVYQVDGLGAYPILYARPVDQPAYVATNDLPEGFQWTDYHSHLVIEDVEQGYFEFVTMSIMARQFYLNWHANYNDTEIVCNADAVDAIIADLSDGNFGMPLDTSQRRQARAMKNIEPLVKLTDDSALVEIIIFTKWGGFYRWTYTISRSFPHTILDVQTENLVEYDCGIMF
jgi:hypothetical protein